MASLGTVTKAVSKLVMGMLASGTILIPVQGKKHRADNIQHAEIEPVAEIEALNPNNVDPMA